MKIIIPNIHPEGYIFIAIAAVIALTLHWYSTIFGIFGYIVLAWCIFFFRDPERITPLQEGLIISPADGVIQQIKEVVPPKDIGFADNTKKIRVSIFLDIFNVHVNRMPIDGEIVKSHYHHGKFFNASLDKASEHNERQALLVHTESGEAIGLVQIAGLIARRIVCYASPGHTFKAGERFGIIRFGSRVDLYLPLNLALKIAEGQTVIGGETVIADLKGPKSLMKTHKH